MAITIKPPKNCTPKDIKKTITADDNKIIVTVTYPNGVIVVDTIEGGSHTIQSSKPLIPLEDGSFQIPD